MYALVAGLALPAQDANSAQAERNEEVELEAQLPKGGWFEDYANYTRCTESPLSYHIFSSLCVLGASLGRRVYKDKGFFRVWPNYCVVLIGPPGKVMKTSAVDIAKQFIKEAALCPIMADKITPEAIVTALVRDGGHHFIYAPEFSVFFGKQRYNEGLTTLMLRLLDSPSEWEAETMSRQKELVTNVALSVLGGSTMSLLAGSTPDQVTSSGFLSRIVTVVENRTLRRFPEPTRGSVAQERRLFETLERMKGYSGEVRFDARAQAWYNDYYNRKKDSLMEMENEGVAEVLSRIPVHLERTAYVMHLAECGTFDVCERCCKGAEALMNYVEKRVPQTVSAITASIRSADSDYLLDVLRRLGGAADHSRLLRRVSSRMDATLFRRNMGTLIESKVVREEKRGAMRFYIIEGETT